MDRLDRYAELAVRVGAKLRPGQDMIVVAWVEQAMLQQVEQELLATAVLLQETVRNRPPEEEQPRLAALHLFARLGTGLASSGIAARPKAVAPNRPTSSRSQLAAQRK